MPFAYLKISINVIQSCSSDLKLMIGFLVVWIITGPFFMIYFFLSDFRNMVTIMFQFNGCRSARGLEEEKEEDD
jgi:hypothetical protein